MLDLYTILAAPAIPANDAADDRPDPTTRITASVETVDADCVCILMDSIAV
jgi:hypothetical protein